MITADAFTFNKQFPIMPRFMPLPNPLTHASLNHVFNKHPKSSASSQLLTNPSGIEFTPFRPPFWLSNPHLQTILPKFFAPAIPNYRRVLVKDSLDESDGAYDFYDADDAVFDSNIDGKTDGKSQIDTPLVVLFHGMEGSSDSHYARALAHAVHAKGWHFVVPHFRSCGGVPVKGEVFYTAGDTDEIHHNLTTLSQTYATIYAVGVSLGGAALANYVGKFGYEAVCQAAAVVSAPVDMPSAAIKLHRGVGHRVYTPYLLNPIIQKALSNQLSESEISQIKQLKRVSDFDHLFTAPRHGYRSATDYYHRASALPRLIDVVRPTLIVSAKDDPFLGFLATPPDVSDSVTLMETEHGGHIGFLSYRSPQDNPKAGKSFDVNWLPETVLAYFDHLNA